MVTAKWLLCGLGLVALSAMLGLTGCEKKEGGGASAGGERPAPKAAAPRGQTPVGEGNTYDTGSGPIKVGHFGSLTGPQATFGQSTSQGLRLAIEEFNAAGGLNGRQVALVEYDTKGDAREAGLVVTRLVNSDKVSAVLGEVASSLSLAGAPVAQQAGVPMVSPSSTNPRVTEVGDMIFRVCFIDPFQGQVCATFAKERGISTVAILYDQSQAYSAGLATEFERAFVKLGGTISGKQTYNEGDQDFTAQLTAIRSGNPGMIFIPGYYTDVANIAIQARKLGVTVPLLGGDGWDSSKLAEIGGTAVEGSFYSNHYTVDDPSPVIQDFIRKYRAKFGQVPDGLAALGYDAARLLFEAMARARSLHGGHLRDAIAATREFHGVTGTISINDKRDAVKPAVIVEMKGGQPRYVATVNPE
ncbi:MAG: ABC transporter substrate-binding protein [Phycisphaerae bacterium]|nr:ABC transporter substrate-binding protein [Phycisphaerae bacterium]